MFQEGGPLLGFLLYYFLIVCIDNFFFFFLGLCQNKRHLCSGICLRAVGRRGRKEGIVVVVKQSCLFNIPGTCLLKKHSRNKKVLGQILLKRLTVLSSKGSTQACSGLKCRLAELSHCCWESSQIPALPGRFSRMHQVNVPVLPQCCRKTVLLFPTNFCLFCHFFSALEPHISLSPNRSLTLNKIILVQSGDVTPKRVTARCPQPPSHPSKSQGSPAQLNAGVQRRDWQWVHIHPVFRVYHHRRMEDAIVPFSVSKEISLTELCSIGWCCLLEGL